MLLLLCIVTGNGIPVVVNGTTTCCILVPVPHGTNSGTTTVTGSTTIFSCWFCPTSTASRNRFHSTVDQRVTSARLLLR